MRSYQDLKLITSELEALCAKMKEEGLGLDDAVQVVSKASQIYQTFRDNFSKETMDVKVLQLKGPEAKAELVSFAWKDL